MLQTILISVAHVAIVTGISIAWCKWYMDKKKKIANRRTKYDREESLYEKNSLRVKA